MTELCAAYQVSRSSYYRWIKAAPKRYQREEQDKADFALILEVYNYRGYKKGARSICMRLYRNYGIVMNLKKIRRLMKKYNLQCPIRKANPYRQMARAMRTNAVADNHLKREFRTRGPRAVLLTDITYIPWINNRKREFAYLSVIKDAYTKEALAHVLSESLEVDFVLETVKQMYEKHGCDLADTVMIHSDQGCHYTSIKFRELVDNLGIRRSMSRRGNCWDNSPQESFFGHMKSELAERSASWASFEDIKHDVDDWIDYYNNERYQWDLDKMSPSEFYKRGTLLIDA